MEHSQAWIDLVEQARAARARGDAAQGAAVMVLDGSTFVATTVQVGPLQLSALDLAVAMAASEGAVGLQVCVVVTDGDVPIDLEVPRSLGPVGVPIIVASPDGEICDVVSV